MKDETLATILIGSYLALGAVFSGLFIQRTIKNILEDRKAVAYVSVDQRMETTFRGQHIEYSYNPLSATTGFVAFDRDGNGEIDEIKGYHRSMVGGRCLASMPYNTRTKKGDLRFDELKAKYFVGVK